ncbi:hypothetical protein [Calycomorphotria hydatis]|uniref:hypothetical protein n=1 Tax=Calycomorphotria hydatis TaxID=2528027 RepID=UPI0011A5791D|nr:hypothetical protein [Calycomorphotria hydatis]
MTAYPRQHNGKPAIFAEFAVLHFEDDGSYGWGQYSGSRQAPVFIGYLDETSPASVAAALNYQSRRVAQPILAWLRSNKTNHPAVRCCLSSSDDGL